MAKTEAPPIYVMRRGKVLIPELNFDLEMIEAIPEGERIRVDVRTGRSPSKLRFYFQLLKKLVDATGCAQSKEALHQVVKLETGHTNPVRLPSGMTVLVPSSVAFDKMTEAAFDEFLERAIEWIGTNFQLTPEQLMGGVNEAA